MCAKLDIAITNIMPGRETCLRALDGVRMRSLNNNFVCVLYRKYAQFFAQLQRLLAQHEWCYLARRKRVFALASGRVVCQKLRFRLQQEQESFGAI